MQPTHRPCKAQCILGEPLDQLTEEEQSDQLAHLSPIIAAHGHIEAWIIALCPHLPCTEQEGLTRVPDNFFVLRRNGYDRLGILKGVVEQFLSN